MSTSFPSVIVIGAVVLVLVLAVVLFMFWRPDK
jgi:hypothetical protein